MKLNKREKEKKEIHFAIKPKKKKKFSRNGSRKYMKPSKDNKNKDKYKTVAPKFK